MTTLYIILALISALALISLGASLANKWRRRKLRRIRAHGRDQEKKAPALMERRGYTVESIHPELRYTLWVDNQPVEVRLEADLIVSQRGKLMLVEVKTGKSASPRNILTRRQLLEYSLHYPVDGLLLLDVDQDQLYEIEFPKETPAQPRSFALLYGVLIGALLTTITFTLIKL